MRLALVLTLLLAGCATTSRSGPAMSQPEPDDAVVRLVGLDFEPRTIRVPIGTRVRWQWTDSVLHNVVSQDFASSKELAGGAHVVRFDRAGTFPYRCTLHAGMEGTVIVTP
ncbi:MAG: cupredoxin domain-containing protein [Acidimicrobiales bacterium]